MAVITRKLMVRSEADPDVWMEVEIRPDGKAHIQVEFGNEMGGLLVLQPAEARALADFIIGRAGQS